MSAQTRQWLYTIAAVASALIPLLVVYKVVDSETAGAWVNLIGVLGTLGSGGAATAAVVTARQRKEGTLNFTGSPAQQAVEAIKATVSQAGQATADLQKVIQAASEVVPVNPSSPDNDPASANYQP